MSNLDEQLMRSCRQGDAEAFDRLYMRYRGPLYRYLLRQCADDAQAQSLYREIWLRVARSRASWKPSQAFRPWLYRLARQRLAGRPGALAPSPAPPGASLPQHDCVARLQLLLGQLGDEHRELFLLREECGLTVAEIAEVTGIERASVKNLLQQTTEGLRHGLQGCDG